MPCKAQPQVCITRWIDGQLQLRQLYPTPSETTVRPRCKWKRNKSTFLYNKNTGTYSSNNLTLGHSHDSQLQVLRWRIICNVWSLLVALMLDFVHSPASDRPPLVGLRWDLLSWQKSYRDFDVDVSKNRGFSPKSSILIYFNGISHYINHPFWGTIIFGNTHVCFFLL